MNNEEIVVEIIVHSGQVRSLSMEAVQEAKKRDFDKAQKLLEEANLEFSKAHKVQTDLIQKEVSGEKTELSLLMVHAQDHLMTGLTVKEFAEEIIEIYKNM